MDVYRLFGARAVRKFLSVDPRLYHKDSRLSEQVRRTRVHLSKYRTAQSARTEEQSAERMTRLHAYERQQRARLRSFAEDKRQRLQTFASDKQERLQAFAGSRQRALRDYGGRKVGELKSKGLKGVHSVRELVRKYGAASVVSYLSLYVGTLSSLYLVCSTGIVDVSSVLAWIAHSETLSASSVGVFGLSWIATKFTYPSPPLPSPLPLPGASLTIPLGRNGAPETHRSHRHHAQGRSSPEAAGQLRRCLARGGQEDRRAKRRGRCQDSSPLTLVVFPPSLSHDLWVRLCRLEWVGGSESRPLPRGIPHRTRSRSCAPARWSRSGAAASARSSASASRGSTSRGKCSPSPSGSAARRSRPAPAAARRGGARRTTGATPEGAAGSTRRRGRRRDSNRARGRSPGSRGGSTPGSSRRADRTRRTRGRPSPPAARRATSGRCGSGRRRARRAAPARDRARARARAGSAARGPAAARPRPSAPPRATRTRSRAGPAGTAAAPRSAPAGPAAAAPSGARPSARPGRLPPPSVPPRPRARARRPRARRLPVRRATERIRPCPTRPHFLRSCSPPLRDAAVGRARSLAGRAPPGRGPPLGSVKHLYRFPGKTEAAVASLLTKLRAHGSAKITGVETELCFNLLLTSELDPETRSKLYWLLAETFEPHGLMEESFLEASGGAVVIEIGPRLNFSTAWSTNAREIFAACGITQVERAERSCRYRLKVSAPLTASELSKVQQLLHDRMTECVYEHPLSSFDTGLVAKESRNIPLMREGEAALRKINEELGLSFDEADFAYYTKLFVEVMKRDPTDVECFDMAQSNSEHCRHWFFGGVMVIDGEKKPKSLFDLVKETLAGVQHNSIIGYHDNSSAIRGFPIRTILPEHPGTPSPFRPVEYESHLLLTAETHNFPSGIAPFPGAETGTGGRIRDVQATGTGANVIAGLVGYSVGNLCIPGYDLPWEDKALEYPSNLAPPLQIEIDASNGASNYGNLFGEPVICGFTRSFGLVLPNGERREYLKPIMFSGGVGQLRAEHCEKGAPVPGMLVVKIGGPAYRIGMGGGAASSRVQDSEHAELDFNAVQRGDAEMENKMNRALRACIELGLENPIVSIHDQGAGGNGNVLKEIVDPSGAKLDIRQMKIGDASLSVLELWGAEFQENCALLVRAEKRSLLESICARENVPVMFLGEVTGDGRIVVTDSSSGRTEVDLDLATVLGKLTPKTFVDSHAPSVQTPVALPPDLTVLSALDRVLRLLQVGSKRFLTNKVDRNVTGLVARQQCVGPLQLPLSDVAVVAQSHFGKTGIATAIGEQPIKGLLDTKAMARLTLGEALTNLVWAKVTGLRDIKCSGNWMWAAKLPGEAAAMYDACESLNAILKELGVAIDGGKDSLSMAASVGSSSSAPSMVKAPGTLVLSLYAGVPDITKVVTPDLKCPSRACDAESAQSEILYVPLSSGGACRLGGSALAQVFGQVGCARECPDMDDPSLFRRGWELLQSLIEEGLVLAGHDVSDGGLLTCLLEMAFAGNCGLSIALKGVEGASVLEQLFAEELGVCVEVKSEHVPSVLSRFASASVGCAPIGHGTVSPVIDVSVGGEVVLRSTCPELRDVWEATSFELDRLQCNPDCVRQEKEGLRSRKCPPYHLSFTPVPTASSLLSVPTKPRVAILREEGSNGDREMSSAFYMAGFEPWDVTVSDLVSGRVTMDRFRGVVFVGGFSYADVLDSAKGWAGVIRYNDSVTRQLRSFYERADTFSLGVCNGCQLMALLGWVPYAGIEQSRQPRFVHNTSGRLESRWATVSVRDSPAILFQGMNGSMLGICVQHGEGHCHFPDASIRAEVKAKSLAPLMYVDDEGQPTMRYPFNPNGSEDAIAALCSPDGRHLAMMPHPERSYLLWQQPYQPQEWSGLLSAPWERMFQNAYSWCQKSKSE